jgi:hypothetical protein
LDNLKARMGSRIFPFPEVAFELTLTGLLFSVLCSVLFFALLLTAG